MKKSKRLISLFLAMLILLSSFTVCFSAFADEAEEKSAAAVSDAQAAIDEFYNVRTALFTPTNANYEKSVAAFDDAAAKLKALSSDEKLALGANYYTFFLYYATEKVGREEAGLTSSNAKVYGSSNPDGLKALTNLVGDFPKDWQQAIDVMSEIYVKVDGTLFNSSFDFQKKNAGYEHYDSTVAAISTLSPEGIKFANSVYPYGDAFYFYTMSPTSDNNYLTDNIGRLTFNYYQDKAGKNDPSSVSYSTFMQGSSGSRTWKDGHSAVTYKAAYEEMNIKYLEDSAPYARAAYEKMVDIFAPVFGDNFKTAANLAYETGMKNFNAEKVTEAEIEAVDAAINAVEDTLASKVLSKIMGHSYLYVASSLTYKLGSSDAYNEEVDANTVYSNQISHAKKNVTALVNDLQNVVNNNRLIAFVDFMKTVDESKLTDAIVKEAIDKYHAMSGEYQGKVPADVKEQLVNIATKGFIEFMNSVDMNNITTAVQEQAYAKYNLMDEFRSTISSELYDKYVLVQGPIMDMNNFANEIAKFQTTPFARPENSEVAWTTGGIQSAVDELWNLVANTLVPLIAKNIDLSNGLDNILKDNLYQPSIIEAIFDLYATLIQDESEIEVDAMGSKMKFKLGQIISWIITTDKIVDFLSADGDKYAGAIAKIKAVEGANATEKVVNLANVTFTAEDFGFKAGDREGFADALLAVLRPITTLLAPDGKIKAMGLLNVDVNIKMFDYMTSDGKYQTGVYASLIPLLEQIGMVGLPTQAEYKAKYEAVREEQGAYIAADYFLKPVIDHLFTDVVDVVSPDPLNGLIKVLPRIAYIIDNDMINAALGEASKSFGLLSEMLSGLDLSKDVINNMIAQPIDLSGLTGSELTITLPPINWTKLANCCTLQAVESSSDFNKYFILRNGDTDSAFSTIFYYVYQVVFADADVYAAVRKLVTDNLGGLASMVTNYTDAWTKIGAVATYGEVLELLGTPTGDEIEKPSTPVDPENPENPSNPDKPNNGGNSGSSNILDKIKDLLGLGNKG
ncbi:MAG: hypothetical protein K2F67_05555, partial [Eubacterium sp.]|nr:hypothetical protein [Eubacterium sp.]